MPLEAAEIGIGDRELEARRLLVERIIASQTFRGSERLTSFLRCVCDLAQNGNREHINEQYIGIAVFGRRPDYDPGADSIVRSHASRLRHRLDRYFAEEGVAEDLILRIPKGGYIPVFEPQARTLPQPLPHLAASVPKLRAQPQEPVPFRVLEPATPSLPQVGSIEPPPAGRTDATPAAAPAATRSAVRTTPIIPSLVAALILMTLVATAALGALWRQHRHAAFRTVSQQIFWSRLFNPGQNTLVVNADSGLVMLQGLTKRRVTLDTYLNGEYLNDLPPTVYSNQQTLDLARRRYTAIVDVRIENKILHLPGADLDHTVFRYARDVRPEEIKRGNIVLLGTYESTPWVQLFEPSMNFFFQNDLVNGVFSIVNRSPRPGEQAVYDSVRGDPLHTIYGVVAFRPSLSGSGNVLILEGQSMAGTETAADFVFDDGYLLPFLHSIQHPDGTIPYFELVLRSRSLSGESSRLEMVASRVQNPN